MELDPTFKAHLHTWYMDSCRAQQLAGMQVDISFQEFMDLWPPKLLMSANKAFVKGSWGYWQRHRNNQRLVWSWQSYAACSTRSFNKTTTCICTKQQSNLNNRPKPGDKLRPEHVTSIAKGLTGRELDQSHKDNISKSSKGQPKQPWTEERKAKRRADLAAKKGK